MASNRLVYLVGVLLAVIVILAWGLVYFARDEIAAFSSADDNEKASSPAQTSSQDGATLVRVSEKTQKGSAIVTRPLEAHALQSRAEIFGTVVNIQSLVEQRARFVAAQIEIRVVQASLTRSSAEYQRMQTLFRDKQMVSLRAVQAAESDWKSDQAKRASSESEVANIRAAVRQQWGEALSRIALAPGREIDGLLSGQQVLVQLSWGTEQGDPPTTVKVSQVGSADKPIAAQFVSAALQADSEVAGRTFWYRAPGAGLRVGMRVAATLEDEKGARNGVVVPFSAPVWHGGKAWIYLKRDDDTFERREVTTTESTNDGWFNGAPFISGDEVVVSGAQLLLSEEFRYQIKDENDD
jgi:hypothetical protein